MTLLHLPHLCTSDQVIAMSVLTTELSKAEENFLETFRSSAKMRLSGTSEWWVGLWSGGGGRNRAQHIILPSTPASLPARMARLTNHHRSNQLATQPTR